MESAFTLQQDNLLPFYLVEDRIKENFSTVAKFIAHQETANSRTAAHLQEIRTDSTEFKDHIANKLLEVEKKIVHQIGQELEGRIIVAINKNMAGFSTRMEEKEKQIAQVSQGITSKLDSLKKTILNQSVKENQKNITKDIDKLEKKMNKIIQETAKKTEKQIQSLPAPAFMARPSSRERERQYSGKPHQEGPTAPENHFTEEWVIRIKEQEEKIGKIEQFMVNFDKRFYENMGALKDNWKQLGEDILQTKKRLTVKQDELRLELIKVKGIKEFEGAPQDYQQTFKKKLMDKFTDLYQMVAQVTTKTDFQSEVARTRKTFGRHDNQLSEIREELAKNSDYFTFYVNNSNTDDLSAQINDMKRLMKEYQGTAGQREKRQIEKQQENAAQMAQFSISMEEFAAKHGKIESSVGKMREDLFKEIQRIDALEQHNNFTPQKMARIHNTLDIQFSPNQQDLLEKKAGQFNQNLAFKDLKSELSKVKDQIFVLTHELAEIEKVKKSMSGLEGKVDKIKVDSEEAILSRKPWVCLSCDKNQKEKHDHDKLKKDASKKRLQEAKALFTGKEKSDKLIKLIPSGEEKFQVYERYREKYMSDSVRLPEIYKEKIGEKEPPLG